MNGNGTVKSFSALYDLFLQRANTLRLSENTLTLYGQTCAKFCTWADNEGIVPQDLTSLNTLAYIGGLKRLDGEPYKVNTLRAHARDIKTMLTFAHEYGIIAEPIKVETPKLGQVQIDYLSDDDQARLIEYVEAKGLARECAIVYLLLDTALRSNEFTNLEWSQVSWDADSQTGTIKDVLGKGKKYRDVHFGARSWHYLQETQREAETVVEMLGLMKEAQSLARSLDKRIPAYLAFKDTDLEPGEIVQTGPIFWRWAPTPKALGNRGLAFILAKMGEDLGLHLHPHKFRHTAIRNWVRSGMPLPAVMKLSGHSSLRMIQHYSELESDDVQALYAKTMSGIGQAADDEKDQAEPEEELEPA
jgi:integrase/recombinase XerC/integrase/recombinase XerD